MISYRPLAVMLKKKRKTFKDMEEELGYSGGTLRATLNRGKYITVETLEKICKVYQCGVEDVIEWVEGEQPEYEVVRKVKLNGEAFAEAVVSKYGSCIKAAKATGKSVNCYSQMAKREEIKLNTLKDTCEDLGLDYKEFIND